MGRMPVGGCWERHLPQRSGRPLRGPDLWVCVILGQRAPPCQDARPDTSGASCRGTAAGSSSLEQGIYGRVGCAGLASLQHERVVELTLEIRQSFELMLAVLASSYGGAFGSPLAAVS